jgi:hypothetical protein
VDSTGFELLDVSLTDGLLKSPRNSTPNSAYTFELVDTANVVIYSGGFDNPLINRFEYEDSENPGQILTKVVELKSTELTFRIPIRNDAKSLTIYMLDISSVRAGQPVRILVTEISQDTILDKANK